MLGLELVNEVALLIVKLKTYQNLNDGMGGESSRGIACTHLAGIACVEL